MKKAVRITCDTKLHIPHEQLHGIQGTLKHMTKENFEKLKKQILEKGVNFALHVWNEKGTSKKKSVFKWRVIDGHGRLNVIRHLVEKEGYTTPPLPCVEIEAGSLKEAKAQVLAASSSYHAMSPEGLYEFAEGLGLGPDGLGDYELPEIDMDEYRAEFYEDPKIDGEDEVPATPKEAKVKRGEIWVLGNHRLMCGDSTSKEDVERLMNGEKADLFLSDPPYGVSYTEKNEYLNSIGTGHRLTNAIENDSHSIEDIGKIWLAAYSNAITNATDRASFYIFSPQGGDLMMMMMIDKAGWTLKHMLVWVKNNHVLGRCDYHYKHEPIFYGWNKVHDFYGGSSCFSIFEFDKPLKNDLHPTMKPVELLEKLVSNSTKKEDKALDLFLGSGSTLIACEKTNRKCYGMEIDPLYCTIIIDRWETFTGKKAVKA